MGTLDFYYGQAIRELEGGLRRDDLWGRAFARSGGDVQKAHAIYIDLLAKHLAQEAGVPPLLDGFEATTAAVTNAGKSFFSFVSKTKRTPTPLSNEAASQSARSKSDTGYESSAVPLRDSAPRNEVSIDPTDDAWAMALAEFEGENRRPGLWAKVFAESGGNDSVAKASYIQIRAIELERERRLEAQKAHDEEQRIAVELARQEYESLPKGWCPNCDGLIPISSNECSKCGAIFGGSGWKIRPQYS